MNYYGEEELTQMMGIGYPGEIGQGPDGELYEWTQGVDGYGDPYGFWRRRIQPALFKRRRLARRRLLAAQRQQMRAVRQSAPQISPAELPVVPQQMNGMGALYQAPDGSIFGVAGFSEDDDLGGFAQDDLLEGLGEDELVQLMGIGQYGEVRRGPDGSLYQWVQGVDGLGNPFGFWKKIRSVIKKVAAPVTKVASSVARFATKPWCIPLQAVPGPVRSVARRVCGLIGPLKPLSSLPAVGSYYRGLAKLCSVAKGCGIAGYAGPLMQAPDGKIYSVEGLGEPDELYGLGNLYQAPDGNLYSVAGYAEQDDLEGYGEDDDLTGYGEDDDLTGYGQANDLTGYGEEDELTGYGEDDLMGYGEDDVLGDLYGYITEDRMQGLDAFVKDEPPGLRKFQAGTPDTWRALW